MLFNNMINRLVGKKFRRTHWNPGTYIYYGCLPYDKKEEHPTIILVREGRPLKKFWISLDDVKGEWEEV